MLKHSIINCDIYFTNAPLEFALRKLLVKLTPHSSHSYGRPCLYNEVRPFCRQSLTFLLHKVRPFCHNEVQPFLCNKVRIIFTTKFDLFVTTKFDFSVTTKFDLFVTTKFDLFVTTKFDLYVTTKFDLIFFELKNEKASRKQLDFVSFLPIIFFNRKCNLLKKLLF